MSSKLVKSQLNSVLRAIDKQQQQGKSDSKKRGKQSQQSIRGGTRGKQARRKATAPEEDEQQQRTSVLAANLRYFSKTATSKGASQDLVTQVGPVAWAACTAATAAAAAISLPHAPAWCLARIPLVGSRQWHIH